MYYTLVLRRQEAGVNHILLSEEPMKTANDGLRKGMVREGRVSDDVDLCLWGFISSGLFTNVTKPLCFHMTKPGIFRLICGKRTQESRKWL